MADAIMDIRGLRKTFGQQVVLDGVDLQVRQGEALAVLGRSGTGKSVLLKLIMRLQQVDDGAIRLFGEEIGKLSRAALASVRKKIGFLFQHGALYDSMTVFENVAFPLARHRRDMPPAEQRDRVQALLERVGMIDHAGKLPSQISGGMQKRVGLARALVLSPSLLLCDEPTAGLDPLTSREIGELIQQVQHETNMTAIVVTHDIQGAVTYSDRLALLNKGKIVAHGTAATLSTSRDPFVQGFFHDVQVPAHHERR